MTLIELTQDGRPNTASLDGSDSELLTDLFERLSPESIYRRFFSPIVRPEHFRASLRNIDHHDREAIAAVEGDRVVGIAQYSRLTGSEKADMAIVVDDASHRQGLATRLITALADRAAAEGIRAFAVSIQGDNLPAIRLLRRLAPGVRLAFADGIGEALIPLIRSETT